MFPIRFPAKSSSFRVRSRCATAPCPILARLATTVHQGRLRRARVCALNILAQAAAACGGDLDRVARCLKLGGFVNCGPDFNDHPKAINGASELMLQVFGDNGKHARFAVGAPSLPLGSAVEVEAVFELT